MINLPYQFCNIDEVSLKKNNKNSFTCEVNEIYKGQK